MILSVSRRTDIPAFYSEWFFNRMKEGFVYVRNPMNIHQVSKILLSPDVIDCIVFWSKNPGPMLSRLDELKDYMYYFQFTVNPLLKQIGLQQILLCRHSRPPLFSVVPGSSSHPRSSA